MTGSKLSVASAVLVLTSAVYGANVTRVDAKAHAQIHLYPFTSDACYGPPVGSPLELKQGECVNFQGAHSVKPMFRPEHKEWIKEVNGLRARCRLETFRGPGCPDSNKTLRYLYSHTGEVPDDLGHCLVGYDSVDNNAPPYGDNLHEHTLYSARLVCSKPEKPDLTCTTTIEQTSWSMDPTGNPHSEVKTETYTGTISVHDKVARSVAVEPMKPTLEPRSKHKDEAKGVWMLHPWSKSVVCYSCYPKKKGDYGKIECRHGLKYPIQCGGRPIEENGDVTTPHTTITATTTTTATTHITRMKNAALSKAPVDGDYTSSDSETDSNTDTDSDTDSDSHSDTDSDKEIPHADLELSQKRSWHTPVKFGHPFVPGQYLCADAEWEKRGRPESYIKIQHCHICDHKDRADSQWIGLPELAVHTESKTTTTTNTIKHMHTRRHDQL